LLVAHHILHVSGLRDKTSLAVKAVGSGGTGYMFEGKGKCKVLTETGHESPKGKVHVCSNKIVFCVENIPAELWKGPD